MKPVLYIVGILLLLFVVILGITAPTARKLDACLDSGNSKLEAEYVQAKRERWNKEQFCVSGNEVIGELVSCYDAVEESSLVPTDFINYIGGIFSKSAKEVSKDNVLLQHNTSCSVYPENLIAN